MIILIYLLWKASENRRVIVLVLRLWLFVFILLSRIFWDLFAVFRSVFVAFFHLSSMILSSLLRLTIVRLCYFLIFGIFRLSSSFDRLISWELTIPSFCWLTQYLKRWDYSYFALNDASQRSVCDVSSYKTHNSYYFYYNPFIS